jgi:hypothetical protein
MDLGCFTPCLQICKYIVICTVHIILIFNLFSKNKSRRYEPCNSVTLSYFLLGEELGFKSSFSHYCKL